MRKRRVILILIGLVVAGGIVVLCRREREPEYGGKRLSEWVEEGQWAIDTSQWRAGLRLGFTNEAAKAVQAMGTNALPFLLAWIQYQPAAWKTESLAAMSTMFHRHFVDHRALRAHESAMALSVLGEKAEPAVPHLSQLVKNARSSNTMVRAEIVLGELGQKLLSADIALMTNSSAWRIPAIRNAARMGSDARPAVPVLLGLLRNSDASVRMTATNALREIDREALEKATE